MRRYTRLSIEEREEISRMLARRETLRTIAHRWGAVSVRLAEKLLLEAAIGIRIVPSRPMIEHKDR